MSCTKQKIPLQSLRMGGATRSVFHFLSWHVQKQTVHNVLRCDPLLYFMTLTGVSKSDYTDCTACDFELLLGVLLYCTERLDWVEGRVCSRFVTGVNSVIFCRLYIHVYIHSFSILSDDRSKASSKTMPPYSAMQSLLLQMRISSPVLKVIQ